MITILTNENFDETIAAETRPSLVKFHAEAGCQPCLDFAPAFEAFAESHPGIACFSLAIANLKDPRGPISLKYSVNSYPTLVSFDKGKLVRSQPAVSRNGLMSPEDMASMTETLSNMSDEKLENSRLDHVIEEANIRKALFNIKSSRERIEAEAIRRMTAATATVSENLTPSNAGALPAKDQV